MRGRPRPGSGPVLAALAASALLVGCGGSHHQDTGSGGATVPSAGAHTLSVQPAHPTTSAVITFGYTAPVASGAHGRQDITYSLSLAGTGRPGCVGAHEQDGPTARRGQAVSIAVGPQELGKPWCPGGYTARVIELQSANCTGSAPCPQYIRVVGIIARTTFTVRSH